jgi:hypothetical protein
MDRISEAGRGGGRCEFMSIRVLRVSSKVPRKKDWKNVFLDMVELGMREALPCLMPRSALSGELFSGICLASSDVPLCLCNVRVPVNLRASVGRRVVPVTPHRDLL